MKTKKHIALLIFLFTGLVLFSQIDEGKNNTKGTTIPLTIKSKKGVSKAGDLTFKSNEGFKNAYAKVIEKKTHQEFEEELKNKGILSKARIAEQNMSKSFVAINEQYKKVDQSLGTYRSDTKFVRILCRDFQYPDGDMVTIYLNRIPVVRNLTLEGWDQEFKIPLSKGLNKIVFKALNQGTSGPNTAAFKVYDDTNSLITSGEWNLATGAVATLVIAKNM